MNGTGPALYSGTSNKYTSTTLVNGDYITVVVSNGSGCQITLTSPAITVIPAATGSLVVSPSNTICAGDNVTFTFDAGYNNYNFKINGTSAQNGTGNTYSSTAITDGKLVTVDVTSANGCITTFGPITMHVNAVPSGTLAIAETSGLVNNDGIICTGATVVFTATSGFTNYNFLLNGASIQTGSSNVYTTSTLANTDKVTVTVTNGSGCVTLFNSYTITVNLLPTVAAITGTTNVCVNSTTALADPTVGGTWSSSDDAKATVDATTGVVTGVAAGTVNIIYTVTNANGCSQIATATVTVNALPVVVAIGGANGVCVNSTIALTETTPGGTWGTADGAIATVDGSGNVTGVADGTVTISYSVTNGNGCTTIVNKTINVHALPVVPAITVNAPATSFDVCVSSNITLSDATSGGTWSSSATGIATINASTGLVTGIADGTATISYIVTDANGCSTTVTQVVNVHALPVPTLSGPNPICPGAVDIYTTETGQSNYNWLVTGGTFTGAGTSSITVTWNLSGPYSISVNYANSNGCFAATSVTVTGNTGTVPTISPDPAPAVCLNSNGTYTTQPGFTNYTWTAIGGTVTPGGNTATVNWTTPGAGSVSVNFADALGCVAATPTVLSVTVNPLPTVTTHDQTVCSPSTVDLAAAAVTSGSTAGLTYTYWTDAAATTAVVNPTAVGAGTYYIEGTTAAGCSSIQSVNVIVNPTPTVAITNPGAVCSPATVDMTASSVTAGSTSGLTFSYWTNAGATSAYGTPATAGAGTYYIKGTTGLGCYDIQPVTVTVNPTPTVVIIDPAPVCDPATVDLTAAAVTAGSTSGLTYTYYTDAAGTTTLANPNAVAISGTYYIKGTAAATGCSDVIKPVTVVINPLPILVINNPAAVCAPSTVDLTAAAVTSGSTLGLTYTYYTDAGGTTTLASPNAVTTSGTYFIKGTTAAGCSEVIKPVTVTVNPLPTAFSVTGGGGYCNGGSGVVIGLSGSESGVNYQLYNGAAAVGSAVSGTGSAISFGNQTTAGTYTVVAANAITGCTNNMTANATVTVNPIPTISGTLTVCQGSATQLTGSGIPAASNPWISGTTSVATVNTSGLVSGASAGTSLITYTNNFGCIATASVIVSAPTPISAVNESPSSVCLGGTSNLSIPSGSSASLLSENFEGTSSFTVTNLGPTTSGTEWSLTNSGYGFDYDCGSFFGFPFCNSGVTFNSGSPHFSLSNSHDPKIYGGFFGYPGSSSNTTNTALVSPSISTVGYTSLTLSYRTYYKYDNSDVAVVEVSTDNGATWTIVQNLNSNKGTSSNFTTQNINLNAYIGLSNLKIRFRYQTINNWWWAIDDIQVTGNAPTFDYSWTALPSASAGLPAGAGTPSPSNASIVVTPTAPGSIIYTATLTNAAGCTSTKDVTLAVGATPVVSITAQYCVIPGRVLLTATSVPAATSYLWNNGATTDTTSVDISGDYDVTVFSGTGCPGTASIGIANELVKNGDFESGNVDFTTSFPYKTTAGSLGYPPGYAVDTAAHYYANFLWGKDHTTGHGKFMMVNGASGPSYQIWQETLNVLPNTTYYFSGWGLELDDLPTTRGDGAPANAILQFNIAGAQIGTLGNLPRPVNPHTDADNNQWVRFYGTWTSGPTTTSVIVSIRDLQGAVYGNNFGLDDISFSTLSTFIYLVSAPGTDAQVVCANVPLTDIVYNVGNGNTTGPTVTGLPDGVTSVFLGDKLTISGTPTVPGNYTYTITTAGCNPQRATGTITVHSQTLTLSSGSANPVQCKTAPVNIGFTLGGTATDAAATGLPVGVTGSKSGNTYTISGTPTDTAVSIITQSSLQVQVVTRIQ